MNRSRLFILLCVAATPLLMGQFCGAPAPAPPVTRQLPSSLPAGVFSGRGTVDVIQTYADGQQVVVPLTATVTFEINDFGIPVVGGAEVAVGRTIMQEGIRVTYTRIEARGDQLVWHADVAGELNGLTASGSAIYTLRAMSNDRLEYNYSVQYLDSNGVFYNGSATLILHRQ